jgi:hypothetical protein
MKKTARGTRPRTASVSRDPLARRKSLVQRQTKRSVSLGMKAPQTGATNCLLLRQALPGIDHGIRVQ